MLSKYFPMVFKAFLQQFSKKSPWRLQNALKRVASISPHRQLWPDHRINSWGRNNGKCDYRNNSGKAKNGNCNYRLKSGSEKSGTEIINCQYSTRFLTYLVNQLHLSTGVRKFSLLHYTGLEVSKLMGTFNTSSKKTSKATGGSLEQHEAATA